MPDKPTEDEKYFGKGKLVYCAEHLAVHATGWCTVSLERKLGMSTEDFKAARYNCERMGLKFFIG